MPLSLNDFGSYTVGGRIARVEEGERRLIRVTRDAEIPYDPRGSFAIEHLYVQYFVPERKLDRPPVVLVHGGGLSGTTWETTPDGRHGWLFRLLERGREVHVVDAVERGRAGFAPGHWDGDPILRSMEEAWELFRVGPADGFARRAAFPGQQFPVDALEALARRFVPRWLSTSELQSVALARLLDRLGGAAVVCHSQGAEIVLDAIAGGCMTPSGLVALEPSSLPDVVPVASTTLVIGDHLDAASHWETRAARWRAFGTQDDVTLIDTASDVAPGGSHMLMMDRNSDAVLEAVLSTGTL